MEKTLIDIPIGRIRVKNGRFRNFRLVYVSSSNTNCYRCHGKILAGESFTKKHGYLNPVCVVYQPIRDILSYVEKENPLQRWIESSDWFDEANGNSHEIIASIARDCGYKAFKFTRSFANMVGYRIEKIDQKLALRYFKLLDEAAEHFPEVKSSGRLIAEAQFGN